MSSIKFKDKAQYWIEKRFKKPKSKKVKNKGGKK